MIDVHELSGLSWVNLRKVLAMFLNLNDSKDNSPVVSRHHVGALLVPLQSMSIGCIPSTSSRSTDVDYSVVQSPPCYRLSKPNRVNSRANNAWRS